MREKPIVGAVCRTGVFVPPVIVDGAFFLRKREPCVKRDDIVCCPAVFIETKDENTVHVSALFAHGNLHSAESPVCIKCKGLAEPSCTDFN